MSRAKLFLENFFAYGLINVLNKIIPLIVLPVITRMLTDPSDFGVYDIYNLIIGFGSPLAILGMHDAMFREYFEKDDMLYRYNVTSTASRIVLITSLSTAFLLILCKTSLSKLLFNTTTYENIVILSAIEILILSNLTTLSSLTRIQNKKSVYLKSNLISNITNYLISIILIKLSFSYYGLIYGSIISSTFLVAFFWILNNRFFTLGKFDKNIAKELFRIGLPLMPTYLIYWVYNSMDKIMITNMLGTTELGIYSVGAKVASISTFIYTAFAGGWQHFAFSTMKDEDYKDMIGKVWENLFVVCTCLFVGVFMFKDIAFKILFEGEYRRGVVVFPYLLFSPFLQMLYQVLGTQFQIIKKTYYSPMMLTTGAIVNVILNAYFIPKIGIEGAAIATLLGFFVTVAVTIYIVVISKKLVYLSKRVYIMMGLFLGVFILINYYDVNIYTISLCIVYLIFCIAVYFKEFLELIGKRNLR